MKQLKLKPRFKSNVRLQDGIILLFLIVLLFILTMTVMMSSIRDRQKQIDMIYDNLEVYSQSQKAQFLQYIDNKISFLNGLTQYPQINQMIPHQQRSFLKNKSKEFGFKHIFVVDNEGTGYYYDDGRYVNHSQESFYYDIIFKNDIFITDPYVTEDGIITTFCVSIYNEDIKRGALCGAVYLEDIATIFRDTTLPLTGQSFLLNRDGEYLVAEDTSKVVNRDSIYAETDNEVSLIKAAFDEQTDKSGIFSLQGKEYAANVTYLEDYDWVIVQCIDNNEIYKEIRFLNLWKMCSYIVIILIIFCIVKIVLYWHQSVMKLNTDALTKCNSRIAMESFIEQLEHEYGKSVAIIYFDLNKFKPINDTYGHDEGDRILTVFASVLMGTFDEAAKVGRIGGDEFIAIAVDITEEKLIGLTNEVNERLQKIREELKLPYELSTSFGYAIRPKYSKTLLYDVMKQADKKMYEYKEKKHNQGKV